VRDFEMELRAKSGQVVQISWSGVQIDIGGERCLLGSALDISERKRAEEKILAFEPNPRTARSGAHRRTGGRQQGARGVLLLGSHDLRAPLRGDGRLHQALIEDYARQAGRDGPGLPAAYPGRQPADGGVD